MGKFHLLAIGSLGEAWVYPENRIDPTNPLGIRNRDFKMFYEFFEIWCCNLGHFSDKIAF